jgi:hypothetical protein
MQHVFLSITVTLLKASLPPAPWCRRYFASVWNYLDLSSYTLMAVVFVLHITRANNQLFRILVALQALLLCIRSLYFLLAVEHLGALVRMVMQVGAGTGCQLLEYAWCCQRPFRPTGCPASSHHGPTCCLQRLDVRVVPCNAMLASEVNLHRCLSRCVDVPAGVRAWPCCLPVRRSSAT